MSINAKWYKYKEVSPLYTQWGVNYMLPVTFQKAFGGLSSWNVLSLLSTYCQKSKLNIGNCRERHREQARIRPHGVSTSGIVWEMVIPVKHVLHLEKVWKGQEWSGGAVILAPQLGKEITGSLWNHEENKKGTVIFCFSQYQTSGLPSQTEAVVFGVAECDFSSHGI